MADNNKFLNLNGLKYYARKLDAKKANIESPNFTGTPTINKDSILTSKQLDEKLKDFKIESVGDEIKNEVKELYNFKDILLDHITEEVSIGEPYNKQENAASNTSGAYVTTSMDLPKQSLYRFDVEPGSRIRIKGVTKPAKMDYALWVTLSGPAFQYKLRTGTIIDKNTETEIDEVITLLEDEVNLFVTHSGNLEITVVGEMVEGKITEIERRLSQIEKRLQQL